MSDDLPKRTPRVVADDIVFGEGPRWHEGAFWFSDMHAHEVVRLELGDGAAECRLNFSFPETGAAPPADTLTGPAKIVVELANAPLPTGLVGTRCADAAGNRIAYVSDESGREEIWVRPFPGPGAATQVSLEGGIEPVWSPDGRELFFRRGTSFLAVPLGGDDGLRPGKPRELFSGRFDLSPTGHQHYAVDSTGERFATIALGDAADPEALHLVLDWAAETLDRSPASR